MKSTLLKILGDIKLIPWPCFVYYQRGDYYKVSGSDTQQVMDTLEPGDVVLRGYDSYLDSYLIPGEYSHSGLYVGNGEIIHAVAEGVSVTTVIDFCRCDRVQVLRPRAQREDAVVRATGWLGKSYDFEFTENNSAFYCHELVAKAFEGLGIHKVVPYFGFLRFFMAEPRYLAESFIKSSDFTKVLEIKPN